MAPSWLAGSRGVLGSPGAAVALLTQPIHSAQHLIRAALGWNTPVAHWNGWTAHDGNSMAPKPAPVDKRMLGRDQSTGTCTYEIIQCIYL